MQCLRVRPGRAWQSRHAVRSVVPLAGSGCESSPRAKRANRRGAWDRWRHSSAPHRRTHRFEHRAGARRKGGLDPWTSIRTAGRRCPMYGAVSPMVVTAGRAGNRPARNRAPDRIPELPGGCAAYCGVIPAAFTTMAHRSVSRLWNSANCAGVFGFPIMWLRFRCSCAAGVFRY